jgi:hypothetical protein
MPNILGGRGVNCILGDIGGVITDALQTAPNKNQIQVAPQLVRILRHSLD